MEEATFVIIGGGIAGVSCAEGLAFLAPDRKVLLITASPLIKAVTNLVPVGQNLMRFDVEERASVTLTESHPSVSVVEDRVVRVDESKKIVLTESGRVVKYERLCLCNGARPKLIAENNPHVLGIRDTESVAEFLSKMKSARRVLVVGNGGIATEIVHEIEGVEMIWVIKDEHISATFVDPGAAEFFQHKLSKSENSTGDKVSKRIKYVVGEGRTAEGGAALGPDWHSDCVIKGALKSAGKVSVEYSCEVVNLSSTLGSDEAAKNNDDDDDEKWPVYAELTNGKIIGCDFVVSATGVVPNSDLTGLENLRKAADGGYSVDGNLRTSARDIFAAGDVCTADWEPAEHWFQMRLWTQALQMGRYAAKSMACDLNGEDFYQDFCFELFTHVTKFFGFKVVLLGLYNGQKLNNSYEIILRMTKGVEYIKLILKGGRMQGAVLIGDTDLEEMCENLILNQLDLTVYAEDLLNPYIDVEDYFD